MCNHVHHVVPCREERGATPGRAQETKAVPTSLVSPVGPRTRLQPTIHPAHRVGWKLDGKPPFKCWNCGEVGHAAKDCRKLKRESTGQRDRRRPPASTPARTNVVRSAPIAPPTEDLLQYLFSSDSDDAGVLQVRAVNRTV